MNTMLPIRHQSTATHRFEAMKSSADTVISIRPTSSPVNYVGMMWMNALVGSWAPPKVYFLPSDLHMLVQPIPIEFEEAGDGTIIACVSDTNIAASGSDRDDAQESLSSWIVNLFDDLTEEDPRNLGKALAIQLAVLRQYVRRL